MCESHKQTRGTKVPGQSPLSALEPTSPDHDHAESNSAFTPNSPRNRLSKPAGQGIPPIGTESDPMPSRIREQKPKKHRGSWGRRPTEQVFEDSRRKRARDREIQELKQDIQDALEEIDRELDV